MKNRVDLGNFGAELVIQRFNRLAFDLKFYLRFRKSLFDFFIPLAPTSNSAIASEISSKSCLTLLYISIFSLLCCLISRIFTCFLHFDFFGFFLFLSDSEKAIQTLRIFYVTRYPIWYHLYDLKNLKNS